MKYGTICSGIGAPEIAATRLGWQCSFMSEIEPFPRAVLQHHYPTHPLHGDFTTIKENDYDAIDVLIGGTPCQSFSVAGKRLGLDDARGNLAIEYLKLAARLGTKWLVWENVPGLLSSAGGSDFAAFLSLLGQCGYGYAWRVLDGQYFGVPQRRRRVILVAHIGDWRRAAAVLFEQEGLRGDITPRRGKEQGVAALTANGVGTCGADDNQGQAGHLIPEIAHTLRADGFDASEDGTGRGIPLIPETTGTLCADTHPGAYTGQDAYQDRLIPIAFNWNAQADQMNFSTSNTPTLTRSQEAAICVNLRGREGGAMPELDDLASVRAASGGSSRSYLLNMFRVRRLTVTECERLMGMPDGYTAIIYKKKPAKDSPRYKSLGNSMIVDKIEWVLKRIHTVNAI